ncbi:hypothetical protein WJX84_002562 [Apatococcus fuscideae]|uniref:UBA domain-containing protein n=1 Tax=Apatococcus fuscideae TaxID=2026836 RepID=A0AAW1TK29_9CHLO
MASWGGEKRGPKLGDAASLWNFTPSPGWSKEEAHLLKLCLMKFGVGRWVQILETRLLPGKLIQQLNGQTQRLLGQQSLAAYTGLQVDIDRIRADNAAVTDAERKGGLIINSGPNLTKEARSKLQKSAQDKYGLSREEISDAEKQLAELEAKMDELAQAKPSSAQHSLRQLLDADVASMDRQEQLAVLKGLHRHLRNLIDRLQGRPAALAQVVHMRSPVKARQAPKGVPSHLLPSKAAPAHTKQGAAGKKQARMAGGSHPEAEEEEELPMRAVSRKVSSSSHSPEAGVVPMTEQPSSNGNAAVPETTDWAVADAGKGKAKAAPAKRQRWRSRKLYPDLDDSPSPKKRRPRPARQPGSKAMKPSSDHDALDEADDSTEVAASHQASCAQAAATAEEADLAQLIGMGFDSSRALDALQEASYNVEAATNWLLTNVV